MKIDFKTTISRLKTFDNIVILLHSYPDGDTIGGGYALCNALQNLGKKARVHCSHKIPKKYEYITKDAKNEDFEAENYIAVDVADYALLGDVSDLGIEKADLSIDHHATNTLFAKETYVDGTAAAACEVIYSIIESLCGKINTPQATALYTGIATDTGCFMFSNTTPKTHRYAAKLIEIGAPAAYINRIMFDTTSKARLQLEKEAFASIIFTDDGKAAIMTITAEARRRSGVQEGELEGISGYPRKIEGVLLGITIREREDGSCKVSVRTHDPVSASDFCAKFGGGGHKFAGGCQINEDVEKAKKLLLKAAEQELKSACKSELYNE